MPLSELDIGAAVVRDYRPEDLPQIKAIHESVGLDYKMPEIGLPIFFIKKVIVLGDEVVAASVLRVEAETYLWLKRGDWADSEDKLLTLKLLQEEVLDAAWKLGVPNVVAWVPRHVERFFAKDMQTLGWSRDREGWISWSRPTEPKNESSAVPS